MNRQSITLLRYSEEPDKTKTVSANYDLVSGVESVITQYI